MLELNTWYKATLRNDTNEKYLNYIFEISDEEIKYISIELYGKNIVGTTIATDSSNDFEENIYDVYEFEKININSYQHAIIINSFGEKI